MTVIDFKSCKYFFLPINPRCTTTTSTTIVATTTTTTSITSTTSTTILPLTTSTTTTIDGISRCGVFLISPRGEIYSYEPSSGTCKFLSDTGFPAVDIANTDNKLWTNNYNEVIREFNITFSPFSISFNRSIVASSYTGAGLTVKSANDITGVYELVGGGSPNSILKFTIGPSDVNEVVLFNMGADRTVSGDIIYNAVTDTYLISNHDSSNTNYITEYTSDGTVVFEIIVQPNDIFSLFVYEGVNYGIGYDSSVYRISPSGITFVNTLPVISGIMGASQNLACIDVTTSTTTTILI